MFWIYACRACHSGRGEVQVRRPARVVFRPKKGPRRSAGDLGKDGSILVAVLGYITYLIPQVNNFF